MWSVQTWRSKAKVRSETGIQESTIPDQSSRDLKTAWLGRRDDTSSRGAMPGKQGTQSQEQREQHPGEGPGGDPGGLTGALLTEDRGAEARDKWEKETADFRGREKQGYCLKVLELREAFLEVEKTHTSNEENPVDGGGPSPLGFCLPTVQSQAAPTRTRLPTCPPHANRGKARLLHSHSSHHSLAPVKQD